MPEMKIPGPDHPITVTANPKRLQVVYNGHVIVDSAKALTLQESTYPAAIYFPREDAEMSFFGRTDHQTHCPYKGDASYFSLNMDGHLAENAVWTYEEPYPAMESMRRDPTRFARRSSTPTTAPARARRSTGRRPWSNFRAVLLPQGEKDTGSALQYAAAS